jgi:hypothetical protein
MHLVQKGNRRKGQRFDHFRIYRFLGDLVLILGSVLEAIVFEDEDEDLSKRNFGCHILPEKKIAVFDTIFQFSY